ncbi:MAG: GNAT family N-acetyltransferase [Massilia sp.]
MLIRQLQDSDVPAVASLLRQQALDFILHESTPEGRATFLRENDEEGIRRLLGAGMCYHVAIEDEALVGFVAVRDAHHLFHMFVDARWHRRGVGRRLWEVARKAALEAGGGGEFTVNASNYAVPVYEALGFTRSAPTQCAKGLLYNPMRILP